MFDFGGGTLDVSIAEVDQNSCRILATEGNSHLGGQDIDNVLIDFIVKKFNEDRDEDSKLDKNDNPKALAKCRKRAREVKELFS